MKAQGSRGAAQSEGLKARWDSTPVDRYTSRQGEGIDQEQLSEIFHLSGHFLFERFASLMSRHISVEANYVSPIFHSRRDDMLLSERVNPGYKPHAFEVDSFGRQLRRGAFQENPKHHAGAHPVSTAQTVKRFSIALREFFRKIFWYVLLRRGWAQVVHIKPFISRITIALSRGTVYEWVAEKPGNHGFATLVTLPKSVPTHEQRTRPFIPRTLPSELETYALGFAVGAI